MAYIRILLLDDYRHVNIFLYDVTIINRKKLTYSSIGVVCVVVQLELEFHLDNMHNLLKQTFFRITKVTLQL